jgi:uncharacterized membrane protein
MDSTAAIEDRGVRSEPARIGRVAAIDIARGLALLGMGAYHLTWDLAYFGLVPPNVPFTPEMRIVSHTVASAFLLLVGVSLALAHQDGFRPRAFWRRLATVAGAALLLSVVTYFIDKDEPILFGILHCVAASSLLAAPLIGAPAWTVLAAAAVALVAPLLVTSEAFNSPALVWLGLGTVAPPSLDWRPLFPWAGVVFAGLALARISRSSFAQLALWRPARIPGRAIAFAGRHSLAIYLIHQPILWGLLFALVNISGTAERHDQDIYLAACRPACVERGGGAEACAKACACVADRAHKAGLSLRAPKGERSEDERARLKSIVDACGDEAQ